MRSGAEPKGRYKVSVIINIVLVLLVIALAVIPLIIAKDAQFTGTDDKAEQLITQIKDDYEPWVKPFWEPPSPEVESLLFALQAALGAGVIGYYIGYVRGRKKKVESEKL